MKLLCTYFPEILSLSLSREIEGLIFSHQDLSVRSEHKLDTSKLYETVLNAKAQGLKSYLRINRFFFDTELSFLKEEVSKLKEIGLDGILFSDLGVFNVLETTHFQGELILESDTTVTSSQEVNSYLEAGINRLVVARELTIEELELISQNVKQPLWLNVFGHQLMSTSRRKLLSAYGEQVNIAYDQSKIYPMQEKTRPENHYLIVEEEAGTHVFDQEILSVLDEIPLLSNFEVGIIDSFGIDSRLIDDYVLAFNKVLDGDKAAIEVFNQAHSDTTFTKALLYKKTSEKREVK